MKNKQDLLNLNTEEKFKKNAPTQDPNPESLFFMQGYEGEMLRELVTAQTNSTKDETTTHNLDDK